MGISEHLVLNSIMKNRFSLPGFASFTKILAVMVLQIKMSKQLQFKLIVFFTDEKLSFNSSELLLLRWKHMAHLTKLAHNLFTHTSYN